MSRHVSPRVTRIAGIVVLLLLPAIAVDAHTSLPASLELREVGRGSFELIWRVPASEGQTPAIAPVLPARCETPEDASEVAAPAAVVMHGVYHCGPEGLNDQTIEIAGLETTISDVLVRIVFLDGTTITRLLQGQQPSLVVHRAGRSTADLLGYLRLGVSHILMGIDHLLFVMGLLLVVRGTRRLVQAITAFTVAHSITLGLATFGIVRVSPTPVEAVIALSIVFLALEIAQGERGLEGITHRQPWVVAFAFGLLHGLGFAGTLSQIGIPSRDIPLALLSFNVGVEAGQIGFVAVFLAFVASWRMLDVRLPAWSRSVPAYTIGTLACSWFFQRCLLIFAR